MYSILRNIEQPSKDLISQMSKMTPATIHEAIGKRGAMHSSIKPIYSGMRVCGPAVTARCQVGNNIMLLKAIDIAKPGDVIVADVGGYGETEGWGEITSLAYKVKGIAGLVMNGSVRDVLTVKEMGFPVFCQGLCIKGMVKETPFTINHPISCGDVIAYPGDLIIGDDEVVVENAFQKIRCEGELL